MIVKHLIEGGIYFMLPIYILWIVVLFLIVKLSLDYSSGKSDLQMMKRTNSFILFFGSFAFLFGVFGQIIGFFQILNVIEAQGEVAPFLIAGGLKITLLAVLYGFGLLLFSVIAWFVFRNLLQKIR